MSVGQSDSSQITGIMCRDPPTQVRSKFVPDGLRFRKVDIGLRKRV